MSAVWLLKSTASGFAPHCSSTSKQSRQQGSHCAVVTDRHACQLFPRSCPNTCDRKECHSCKVRTSTWFTCCTQIGLYKYCIQSCAASKLLNLCGSWQHPVLPTSTPLVCLLSLYGHVVPITLGRSPSAAQSQLQHAHCWQHA